MRPKIQNAGGFTLVELIVVSIVLGIMAAVLAPLMLSSLRAYDYTLGDVVVLDKLRYATERLAREIREINYDSSNGFDFIHPSTGVEFSSGGMGSNSMKFKRTFYDTSGTSSVANVTVGNNGSNVTLAYSTIAIPAQILTNELNGNAGLAFAYFTSDGVTTTTDPMLVRSVEISLTLLHNGNTYPQRTRVELKNR